MRNFKPQALTHGHLDMEWTWEEMGDQTTVLWAKTDERGWW